MKKVFCEIHLFELHQNVFIIDDNNNIKQSAITTIENLPKAINAVCDKEKTYNIVLGGNSIYGEALKEKIINYSKNHYTWSDNIEIEVLKK